MNRHEEAASRAKFLNQPRSRRTLRIGWSRILLYFLMAALFIVTVTPLISLVFASLKGPIDSVVTNAFMPPHTWRWSNYVDAWVTGRFGIYFFNSLLVAVAVTVSGIFLGLSVAYSMVILKVPFNPLWMALFMMGLILPEEAIIMPSYFNMHSIGLINTYWALILPQAAMSIAFASLFLRPGLLAIPAELLDCARIDGCSRVSLVRHVIFPLIKPALSSLVVLFFLGTWNDFTFPLVLTFKDSLRTLPLGLYLFQTAHQSNITLQAAGTIIAALPVVIIYLLFQKTFIEGITEGAVKG
ncbi:MAG: carbohydrate ABC transporter permease [Bacillota bacterium]